jgi:hypothetical protein
MAQLGCVFGINKGIVHRICKKEMGNFQSHIGHPYLLSAEREETVITFIVTSFRDHCPVSPKQIRVYVQEQFNLVPSRGWLWHFVRRHSDRLEHAKAHPQEEARMNVTQEIARRHVANLEQYVRDLPTELIFNLDEVGSQEWADRKPRSVIIPRQPRPVRIEYSVPRAEKRMSCIATISMAGDALMPLLVIHRKTIDDAVWEEGWRNGQDFLIRSNDTSYVTRDIFKEYLTSAFLPYVASTRASLNLHEFPAVLLCDNCSSHIDGEIMLLLASHNVRLLTFPPHTSNLFQPLDLVTFAILKREKREIQVKLPAGSQVWGITRLMKALERATDSSTNRSAFKRAGLVINPSVCPPVAMVNSRELLRRIDESVLPRGEPATGNDAAPDRPMRAQHEPVFGFLNEAYFSEA